MKKVILAFLCVLSPLSYANSQSTPPELWSWFKDLNKSAKACEIQSSFILQKLKVENQTENEYGLYGNIKGNRIVVKCIAMGETSKLWVAVAGNDRDSVEYVRNLLIKEIQ
ncbi:MAG: hypothetical protein V4732_03040 [Pseudomonadota bacterium]